MEILEPEVESYLEGFMSDVYAQTHYSLVEICEKWSQKLKNVVSTIL